VSATPADEWHAARDVADLANLTARWLEGDLSCQPGYEPDAKPDPETTALIPVLADLNRAGWLTYSSQPGCVIDRPGAPTWEQRAAVHGITARAELVATVKRAATACGLVAIARPIRRRAWRRFTPRPWVVTRRGGQPVTVFGSPMYREDVATWLDGCGQEAITAAMNAVHLTVVDAVWGRDCVLWPCLAAAAALTPEATGTSPDLL
jgi:hypothetical protein